MNTAVTAAAQARDQRLAADAVAEVAEQVGQLEETRGQDDRRGEQERETRRVAVVQAPRETGPHRHPVATDARHQRRRLGDAYDQRLAELERVQLAPAVGLGALAQRQFAHLGGAAEALGRDQQHAVDHQEDRSDLRLGGERAQRVLECRPRTPAGMLATMISQAKRSVGVSIRRACERVEERARRSAPSPARNSQQPQRAADVEHHHQSKPEGFLFGLRLDELVPPEQRRKEHRVPKARDREQLAHALQHAQHDRLEVAERGGERNRQEGRHRRESLLAGPDRGCSDKFTIASHDRSRLVTKTGTLRGNLSEMIGKETTRPPRIAVALHDIEPATFERCALIRDWLDDHGVDRVTLLVIPARDLHPLGERCPELIRWLGERRLLGDSIAQHGFQHEQLRRGPLARGGLMPTRGGRSAEFVGLDESETRRALDAGWRVLKLAGVEPDGFVAPAYAYTPALRRVLPRKFRWWASLLRLHRASTRGEGEGTQWLAPAWGMATDGRTRHMLSPSLIRAGSVLCGDTLRVDLHPADLEHPRHMLALEWVLARSARRREAVTFEELCAGVSPWLWRGTSPVRTT